MSKPYYNSTAEMFQERLERRLIPTPTIPPKYQATCDEELKSSSISYCNASILEQSKSLVSWSIAADSLDLSAAVFTEHELKEEQIYISLKGHTPQNGRSFGR